MWRRSFADWLSVFTIPILDFVDALSKAKWTGPLLGKQSLDIESLAEETQKVREARRRKEVERFAPSPWSRPLPPLPENPWLRKPKTQTTGEEPANVKPIIDHHRLPEVPLSDRTQRKSEP